MKASIMYAEQKKIHGRLSTATIAEMFNHEYNVIISARSIQRYVQQRRTGEAPDGCGPNKKPPAALCPKTFKLLLSAHLQLNQLNQEGDKKIEWNIC